MSKKTTCKNCAHEFIPTTDVQPVMCPACSMPAAAKAAVARAAFAQGEPVLVAAGGGDEFDIQWMPPGMQSPVCFVDDEPRQLNFTVTANHARAFNAQLQRLINLAKAGKGDLPYIDFNHEDGRASGRPTELYYGGEDPKCGGIRCKGKWTASGKSAVTGEVPDFTRFSPEWLFDDSEEPIAIGVNLGGLVNKAAFKTIASVKAGAATNKNKTMTKAEFTEWMNEALKPITTEVAALKTAQGKGAATDPAAGNGTLDVATLEKALAKGLEPINLKLKEFETNAEAGRKAQAKAAVGKFITAPGNPNGVIAPADTDAIAFWENAYLANAADAEKQLGKMKASSTPRRFITDAGSNGTTTATSAEFSEVENRALAGAKKLRETNKAIASDAQALEVYLRTPEGNALYADILAGRSDQRRDVRIAR
jgi:hypothetical protein